MPIYYFSLNFSLLSFHPDPNYLGRSVRLLGLLVDREFGIAAWQPAYLLLVPAVAYSVRTRRPHRVLLIALLGTGWLVATFLAQTMHGWWWPGRQLVVVLPAAVLLLALWIDNLRMQRLFAALGALGVLSFVVIALEATTDRRTLIVDFYETANPLYQAWSRLLPGYRLEPAGTRLLHTIWLMAIAGLAWWGWRSAAPGIAAATRSSQGKAEHSGQTS